MCSEWCFSKTNVDICAALCFFLLTDSVVTEPCNVTPAHTDIWVGRLVYKKKTKTKTNNPSTRKTKSLASLSCCIPSQWQKMSCECWGAASASWCSFTWVRFVSCVPQGLAPTRIVQGVKVMAKWKHHLPRCLQHTLPLRAPPGSALLVKCHQKLG